MVRFLKFAALIVISLTFVPTDADAQRRRRKSKERLAVKPEIIYRQVSVGHRRQSVFYKDSRSADFVDQIYLTTRLEKSYDYRFQLVLEPAFYTVRDDGTKEVFEIQQAYGVGQLSDSVTLTAGRKVEFTGSGYFVNPSDVLFEDKNLLDPLEQKTGKNMTKLTFETDESSLSVGYLREINNDFRDGTGFMRFETIVGDADVMLQQSYRQDLKTTTGISAANFFTDSFELHFDGRHQTTQRRDREYLEYSALEREEDSFYYVLGSRYVFTPKRTAIVEWVQNTGGLAVEEVENYHAVLVQRKIDIENSATNDTIPDPYTQLISRRYLFAGYIDEESVKNWSFTVTLLQSLGDGSQFITGEIKYNPAPIFSIGFSPTFFVGEPEAEFGQQPAHAAHYLVMKGTF